jgi:hypothetical protein
MAIDPALVRLSPEQQKRLAAVAEETGQDWRKLVDDLLDALPNREPSEATSDSNLNGERVETRSLYDVLLERGILGCFDGPTDLSTNPKHMEGFGEHRYPKSSN